MGKKIKTATDTIKTYRKNFNKKITNMSIDNSLAYYRKQSALGMELFQEAIEALPPNNPRDEQLLIRLTKAEKEILERDAATEKAKSVSALVRSRSLVKESPLQLILNRLDSITKRLNKIEAQLARKK
ncbi:MAG: hypothetical protein LBL62_09105 [Planctomycetaceae bacterium]|jgi:hypothetical protein|nr:hypothetical protein [Planctomycetaceae bacterium]